MRLVSWESRLQSPSEVFFATDLTHVVAKSVCEDCEAAAKPETVSQAAQSEEPAQADQAARLHSDEVAREDRDGFQDCESVERSGASRPASRATGALGPNGLRRAATFSGDLEVVKLT